MSDNEEVIGFEVEAVSTWLDEHVPSLASPFTWTRLEGGHSNFTYRIDDSAGNAAVVRRPPMGKLLPKAHDMAREWAIISALDPTPVPVAKPLGFCESPDVTGAHFYAMGVVDGMALYLIEDVDAYVPVERRPTLGHSFIDVLAELHALDPDEIGLGDLGRKEDYVARQIRTWYGSWEASKGPASYDKDIIHETHDVLVGRIPEQGPARVVHGDYGLHNVMAGPDSKIAAVLDWEISTLGDPMADLAYAMNAWVRPGDPLIGNVDGASLAPGLPERDEMLDRYVDRTGADLTDLPFYLAFNYFKSSCILHGVYARYVQGQKEISEEDLEELKLRLDNTVARVAMAREELG